MVSSINGMGNAFDLKTSFDFLNKDLKFQENGKAIEDKSFGKTFAELLDKASSSVVDSEKLSEQFILNPDSVDSHDVTIAIAKANMGVSIAKAVVDGGIRAYKEIINMR